MNLPIAINKKLKNKFALKNPNAIPMTSPTKGNQESKANPTKGVRSIATSYINLSTVDQCDIHVVDMTVTDHISTQLH